MVRITKDNFKRPTLHDVARSAGVSIATVSNVINQKNLGNFDEETEKRVLAACVELNYIPNASARHLRTGRARLIALINTLPVEKAGDIAILEYMMLTTSGAGSAALPRGYALVTVPLESAELYLAELPLSGALIMDPTDDSSVMRLVERRRLPHVSIGRTPVEEFTAGRWVDTDSVDCIEQILTHLRDQGARRIALLSPPPTRAYSYDAKLAYLRWTEQAEVEPIMVEAAESFEYDLASGAIDELLARSDAVYVVFVQHLPALASALQSRGIEVPRDYLLAAGMDGPFQRLSVPQITTIDVMPELVGRVACNALIDSIEGLTDSKIPKLIKPRLLLRGSSKRDA